MTEAITFRDFWGQAYATPVNNIATRFFSQRVGALIAYLAYKAGLRPNPVTLAGLALMVAASVCLGLSAEAPALAYVALVLYQLGFCVDCADGQLARATKASSQFGFWLDHACDHLRFTAILIGVGALLIDDGSLHPLLVALSLFLLGGGSALGLHTALVVMSGSFRPHGLQGTGNLLRAIVINLTDTPVVLLTICLLAPLPSALAAYVGVLGVLSLVQAVALAVLRVK